MPDYKDRERKGAGGGGTVGSGKVPVLGLRERGGRVRAEVVPDVKRRTLHPAVTESVRAGSTIYTDANRAYIGLDARYSHETIDHAEAYVDGRIHTNGLENFWSLLTRGLHAPTFPWSRSTCSATWTSGRSRTTCVTGRTTGVSQPSLVPSRACA